MIRIKYKALFDIELRHSFYVSGLCPDMEVVPSAGCRAMLGRYGLKYLPTEAGLKLFAKVETVGGKDLIKNPIPNETKFTFLLKLRNSYFENFTQTNLSRLKTQHYYFNNLTDNVSADSVPLLLSDTTAKTVTDTDLLGFETNTFSFTEGSTEATLTGELRFTDSGEVFSRELTNHNNTFNFSYDLKAAPSGRAKFFIGTNEKAEVYSINAADYGGLFGVAEIFYKSTLPASYQFQQADNAIETRFYKITFANRSTRWRYIINNKFNPAVTGVNVAKTNGTPISFAAQGSPPAGQFIIASGSAIPLKQQPLTGIRLTDQANNEIMANLPNPPLGLIRQEGADVFSDVLITI